jgi:hypothetical protein
MNGKVSITSSRERVLNSVVGLCRAAQQAGKEVINSTTLETSIIELVRDSMREIAAAEHMRRGTGELLLFAINKTEVDIRTRLKSQDITCDIASILEVAQRDLKHTAGELEQLSASLSDAKRTERVKLPISDASNQMQPYTIHQIGLEGSPTGLLAQPASNTSVVLDFDAVQSALRCEIDGEQFPVEVTCEEHIFVVDDDGSVFVSVDGLPPSTVERIGTLLHKIATVLYS